MSVDYNTVVYLLLFILYTHSYTYFKNSALPLFDIKYMIFFSSYFSILVFLHHYIKRERFF